MECADNQLVDSYTRYRRAATTLVHQTVLQEYVARAALFLGISVIWGYVAYVALGTAL